MAIEKSPSVIFIDDIDFLCGSKISQGDDEMAKNVRNELLD